ncbi:MAG: PilZ domain-containing protein [Planctomycetes bacterium]|nr:PilZ domain-containing protein [Planctomycetota bacterium]
MATAHPVLGRIDLAAQRVLDQLERWERRLNGNYAQKRDHVRRRFRGKVVVFVPSPSHGITDLEHAEQVLVWTRNVSQGGICFIANRVIPGDQIVVRLRFAGGGVADYRGSIVRRRQVHESFWEYGVAFCERLSVSDGKPDADASKSKTSATNSAKPEISVDASEPAAADEQPAESDVRAVLESH